MPAQQQLPPTTSSRNVPTWERIRLYVAAGGRCEFPGCNKFLLAHDLTKTEGNYAEQAHIVAFQKGGPRGDHDERPSDEDLNTAENLMLLCRDDHKLIDDSPEAYRVEDLRRAKLEHETRIHELTGLGPAYRRSIIQLRGPIGGQHVDVPAAGIRDALRPFYPASLPGTVIDLTGIRRESPTFFALAQDEIKRVLAPTLRTSNESKEIQHFAVFALAPIPTLVCLGRELGDKLRIDLFQRHLDQSWRWREDGEVAEYEIRGLQRGEAAGPVGLMLSLSGRVLRQSLPDGLDPTWALYEITLVGQEPSREFLRRADDLLAFIAIYRRALREIATQHPGCKEIHLFPAVPAPVAIACGQHVLPKASFALRVYDNLQGKFTYAITTNRTEDL